MRSASADIGVHRKPTGALASHTRASRSPGGRMEAFASCRTRSMQAPILPTLLLSGSMESVWAPAASEPPPAQRFLAWVQAISSYPLVSLSGVARSSGQKLYLFGENRVRNAKRNVDSPVEELDFLVRALLFADDEHRAGRRLADLGGDRS
jgi:hypothetical protein